MSTRVYIAGDWESLDEIVSTAREDPHIAFEYTGPAHAVTERLRALFPESDDEQLEYFATVEAAQDSLENFHDEGEPFRRLVYAVDVDRVESVDGDRPSLIKVDGVLIPTDIVAYLVDDDPATADVEAAVVVARRARGGETVEDEEAIVERCLENELLWFGATEQDALFTLAFSHSDRTRR